MDLEFWVILALGTLPLIGAAAIMYFAFRDARRRLGR